MKPILLFLSLFFVSSLHAQETKHVDITQLPFYKDMSWIKDAVILINNNLSTYAQVMELDSAEIVKIEAYRKKEAIAAFGKDEGKKGVVIITTKKKRNEIKQLVSLSDSVQYYTEGIDTVYILNKAEKGFVGGAEGWQRFLIKNLNASMPVDNDAPAGVYIVMAEFVIDENGKPTKIKIPDDPGYGTGKEVVRILTLSPPWKIVYLNGRPVKTALKQQVTFMCSVQ